ncbi:MAG: cytochrome c [Flavobacteriia bacterium]|nr:MAG: cytochrome c [Flavobacteriia bacterium]
MKKVLFASVIFALLITSCGKDKKAETKTTAEPVVEQAAKEVKEVKSDAAVAQDQVAMGEKLFTSKTCASCHAIDTKLVGPSVKDIVKKYEETNGNIVAFLKEKSPAIVDTDPGQVAIMKGNLDGFVKDLTGDELQAIAAYMRSKK